MGRWQADFSGDDGLGRIVMLLVSLAALAERAACVSAPRRREVLGILLPAEAAAWAFLVELATGGTVLDAPADDDALAGNSPAREAVHLAVRLRTLALCLILLSAAVGIAGSKFVCGRNPLVRIMTGQRAAPAVLDTS